MKLKIINDFINKDISFAVSIRNIVYFNADARAYIRNPEIERIIELLAIYLNHNGIWRSATQETENE